MWIPNDPSHYVFSDILKEVIAEFDQAFNRVMLHKFLTVENISPLTVDLLENEEWGILEVAVIAIFTEEKDQDLLPILLHNVGEFVDNDNDGKVKEMIVKAFTKASRVQFQNAMVLLENLIEYTCLRDEVIESLFFSKLHKSLNELRFDSSMLTTLTKYDKVETEVKNDFINLSLIEDNVITKKTITYTLALLNSNDYDHLKYLVKFVMIYDDYISLESIIKLLAKYTYRDNDELEAVLTNVADGLWLNNRVQHERLESILDKIKMNAKQGGNAFEEKFYHALNKLINCETVKIDFQH